MHKKSLRIFIKSYRGPWSQDICFCYLPAGRFVYWKPVTEVLKMLPLHGGRPRAGFSSLRSQFFTMLTSQPVHIYIMPLSQTTFMIIDLPTHSHRARVSGPYWEPLRLQDSLLCRLLEKENVLNWQQAFRVLPSSDPISVKRAPVAKNTRLYDSI